MEPVLASRRREEIWKLGHGLCILPKMEFLHIWSHTPPTLQDAKDIFAKFKLRAYFYYQSLIKVMENPILKQIKHSLR